MYYSSPHYSSVLKGTRVKKWSLVSNMWNEKATKPLVIIYISCLFLATFFIVPTVTSFYYYAWGKHLAWSYFDGPPMIAYFFSISHALFGNTFFSINSIGFFCVILGAFYIYKTGCLLHNQRTGLISALIWVALPTTTESIFIRVLYDAPLNLFTILAFYYFARYCTLKRFNDLYLSALFIGAMILSKYTAIVSVMSLFFYLVFSKQRQLFKSVHFYRASLIIFIITIPILYWNAHHHWISITYLLNFHSQAQTHTSVTHSLLNVLIALIINYSVFLLLALVGWFKTLHHKMRSPNLILELQYTVLVFGICFWFITTLLGGDVRAVYLTPLGINISLIAGYTITHYQYYRFFKLFYPVFLLISLVMILANSWPIATYLKKGRTYSMVQKALNQTDIIKKGQPVVAGYFGNAATLSFFMPDREVYAIPCEDINQYQYWSDSFLKDLYMGKIDKITYVDFKNTKQCAERYFNKCQSIATLSHHQIIPVVHKVTKPVSLYVYECYLPKRSG